MQMQNYTKIIELQEAVKNLSTPAAEDVSYDGSASHVDVDNLQAAVDRAYSEIHDIGTSLDRLNTSTDRVFELLGDTDISDIGDGTVTGAIDDIDDNLSYKLSPPNMTNIINLSSSITVGSAYHFTANNDGIIIVGANHSSFIRVNIYDKTVSTYQDQSVDNGTGTTITAQLICKKGREYGIYVSDGTLIFATLTPFN